MAAGNGVTLDTDKWWYQVAASLGRQINSGGVGGETYTQAAARQVADLNFPYRTQIFWAGHNSTNVTNDMAAIASMVAHLQGQARFIVLLPTIASDKTANDPTVLAERAAIVSTYPNNYIDIPSVLAAHGDGSANDNSDIANGYTPRSLRAAADTIHLNASGQAYVKAAVQAFIQSKGW